MKFFSNIYSSNWEDKLIQDAIKNGAFEGKSGRPSPESVSPDENEQKYHSKALELVIKANNELTKQIRSLLPKIADEKHKISEANAECAHRENIETIKSEIISSRDEHRQELHKAHLKLISAEGHLNSFKTIHQIKHEPDHPSDIPHYLSIVFLIMIAEAALNSYFWSKGSGHGLAGGYIMAIVLAISNIALAIFSGILFTYINLEGKNYKTIGISSLITGSIAILLLNFYIATKRNLILSQMSIDAPVTLVFQETESTILFILGVLFAAYAFYKGYRLFGSVPGYKKVYSDYEIAFSAIKDTEKNIKNSIKKSCDSALNKLSNVNSKISIAKQKCSGLEGEIKLIEKDFSAVTKQIRLSFYQIINKYRAINSSSRPPGIEVPIYFSENMDLDIEITEELNSLISDINDLKIEIETTSTELTGIIKSETIEINQIKSESIGQLLTDYFDSIKENARQEYISLIPK